MKNWKYLFILYEINAANKKENGWKIQSKHDALKPHSLSKKTALSNKQQSYDHTSTLVKRQEVHGPHHSPEKPVKINIHFWEELLYHNIDKERKKFVYLLYMNCMVLICKSWVSSHKDASCQVCLKLAPWFLRGRFLNFVNAFPLFHNYLPME